MNPIRLISKAIEKKIVAPLIYGQGDDYDAERYWGSRFKKYGINDLRGPGDEGLSNKANWDQYEQESSKFVELFRRTVVKPPQELSVLEIGTGTGFYTRMMDQLGVRSYTGLDVTDVFFPEFRQRYERFNFIKADVCSYRAEQKVDVVLMFDVIEHIVTRSKFEAALAHVQDSLHSNGLFFLTGFLTGRKSKRHLFYNTIWSLSDVISALPGMEQAVPEMGYRGNYLTVFRKQ